ncbi:hypothetical protein ACRAD_28720 (plasmid) [Acinetobacter radioresistens DSM 6976 = NBRC 102413 = CIP 103788]|nr:hypothetical protein ACRAD_28720 [Acinetobacter radioresistens DSM 6976 = NBRC 102413 = CIP 103788]
MLCVDAVMEKTKKFEITKFEKIKLFYINFFPVVFLSFTSLYLLVSGHDPKGFLLTNVLISISIILIPLLIAVCMLATKILYKDQNKQIEYASIGIGLLCLFFMTGCNYYQYYKFAADVIPLVQFEFAFTTAMLLGCFVSIPIFVMKYLKYTAEVNVSRNLRITHMLFAGMFPLLVALSSYFF